MRFAITAAFVVSLAIPLASTAQPAGNVYRIGLVTPTSQAAGIEAFREGLRTLGYVEGQNVVIEHRSADGRFDGLPGLTAELVRLKVDVIVAVVTQASLAAKNATKTIPIVTETAARSLGIQLRFLGARDAKEIDSAFATFAKERPEALAVIADPVFVVHRAQIATLAATHHLASVSTFNEYPEAGGLMAYAPSFVEPGVRAAAQVDKIFKGAMPADLPVERTTKYTLVVNRRTAKVLGLTIPPSVSVRVFRQLSFKAAVTRRIGGLPLQRTAGPYSRAAAHRALDVGGLNAESSKRRRDQGRPDGSRGEQSTVRIDRTILRRESGRGLHRLQSTPASRSECVP